jgi:hypothetical protein
MFLATGNALAVAEAQTGVGKVELQLKGLPTQCVAVDPETPERIYCGTFGRGLWRSADAGRSWEAASSGIPHAEIMSVAVSPLERSGDLGVVWAGTEPSALFRSENGGTTWEERASLRSIPSAPTWSFPPRPWTSHVRWIAPDPNEEQRLFVGIELGGVMRSQDAGLTWEDRKPGSQYDAHTLRTHRLAPGRVYEAAGGGYAESRDGGASWQRFDEGLTRRYVWGLAIDPRNPNVMLVSAAPGPREAHGSQTGEAAIYRRVGDAPWEEIRDGLPPPRGTRAYVLATCEAEPGSFYAATRDGNVYRSADAGISWERLELLWPEEYQTPDVNGFVVV